MYTSLSEILPDHSFVVQNQSSVKNNLNWDIQFPDLIEPNKMNKRERGAHNVLVGVHYL